MRIALNCPQKDSKLFKRLKSQLNDLQANKLYQTMTSESFDKWYKDGKRDKNGLPLINNYLRVFNSDGESVTLFDRVTFNSVNDVEKFLSSQRTKGITKYKSGKYYVSKERRIEGIRILKGFNKYHPGLLTTSEYRSTSSEIGVKDQSMPIMKININKDYFNGQMIFNSEVADNVVVDRKEDPRDYIINRLEEYNIRTKNKLQDLKRDFRKATGEQKAKLNSEIIKYEKLYNQNEENIANLRVDLTKANILNQAKIDLAMINKTLTKGELTTEELAEIGNLIDLYKDIADTDARSGLIELEDLQPRLITKIDENGNEIDVEDITDLVKNIQEVGSKYQSLANQYDNLIKEVVTKEYNKQRNTQISVEELFKDTKDLGLLAQLRDSGSTANRLVQLLNFVRTNAAERANTETLQAQQERERMSDGLKKSKLFKNKQDFMKLFWQKDADGNETGGLVNRYTDKYWQFRNRYFATMNSKDKAKITKAKKEHYNNHEYINYFETEDDKNVEIYRLASTFGLDRATELVEDQALKFEEYRIRRDEKFEDIDGSESLNKELDKEIWELQNNPDYTIKNLKNGTVTPNPKGGNIYNSFEFVRPIPLKVTRNEGKETGFYDSTYELIESDEVALEYYNYVKNTIKDLLKQYPQSYLSEKGVHQGFIPMITKKLISDMVKGGLKSSFSNIAEITRDLYTTKTFSKTHNHIKPGTGAEMNTLNISMLSPKFKTIEDGKVVDTEDIVTDLDEILKAFIPVTNLYKHKTRIEGSYNLIADSIKLLKGSKETATGIFKRNNDNEKLDNNLTRLNDIAEYERDVFYGKVKVESATGIKKYSAKDKEVKLKLEKEQAEIKEKLEEPELLTEVEEENLRKRTIEIENTIDDLGRNVSGSKAVRSILKYYQYITQSWNLPSSFIELAYGNMSNRITASAGIDYTSKQIARAYRIAHTALVSGGTDKGSKKFNSLIEKLNIIGDVHDRDKEGSTNSNKKKFGIKNIYKPFYFQLLADKYSKGTSAIAVMMNTDIIAINGEISNLYDAMDETGNLKPEFQTEQNLKDWSLDVNTTDANELQRLRAKIIQINKRNHGNYDPNSPIPFLKTAGGEAVFQFRRWMIEGVASRWEGERYDDNLERIIRGRYKTYGRAYKNAKTISEKAKVTGHIFLLMGAKLIPRGKKIFEAQLKNLDLQDDTDVENMRKNAQGAMFVIMIYTMLLLFQKLSGDDDEDKDFSSLNFLVNMGGRLQQDLWFYANPGEGSSLTQNIVPAMKLYDKVTSWGEAVYQTITESDPEYHTVYKSGTFKGWDKWLIKTGELIPGSAAIIKDTRLGDKVIQ